MTVKRRIFEIINPAKDGDSYSKIFDLLIMSLIVLNVISICATTFDIDYEWLSIITESVEIVSVAVFTLEYALRLWTSDMLHPENGKFVAMLRYIFSFMAIVDLLSILPFYLPFFVTMNPGVLDTMRIIRLLRVFKLHRYTTALSSMHLVLKRKASQLTSSVSVILILTVITSIIIYNIESEAQPEVFQNAFSGFWWSVATFTTVGYGDIVPVTVAGKLFSSVIAFLGVGLIAVPTGIISAGFVELNNEKHQKELKKIVREQEQESEELIKFVMEHEQHFDNTVHGKKSFCPYCGEKLD